MSNEREQTKYIIIHSTDTLPEKDLSAKDVADQDRKEGWLSCRFHKVITRDGNVEDGRDIKIAGAHIENSEKVTNANSIGICLVGGKGIDDKPDCNFTLKQYNALSELVSELKLEYKKAVIMGYRDVADVLSPHFNIKELLR
ncbi:lysozyme [Pelagibacter phage HTVC109P]|jgi:N-acetylmuramoyl-L-alanine amidase|nr:lysozyme [Pelagibacter phage HTVC109P]|tara:strand:- start:3321 stop:3746 length:426 start_codon:yes stop_codon:yes gene_type:complete